MIALRGAALVVLTTATLACDRRAEQRAPTTTSTSTDTALAQADSLYLAGDVDGARAIWLPELRAAETRGDSSSIANLLTSLGLAHRKVAEYAEARDLLERSLSLKLRLGMRGELFRSLNALGLLAEDEGRLADATNFYERATAAARDMGDSLSAAKATHNQGLVHRRLGEFNRARAEISRLIDVARSVGDTISLARATSNLAMLNAEVGDALGAVAQLHEVRRLGRVTGDVELEDNALGQLAMAYDALGDPTAALAALDSALSLTRRHGMRRQEAENLRLLGDLYADAGDVQRALNHYANSQSINSQLDLPEETADALLSEAQAHFSLQRSDLALRKATQALRIHRAGGFRFAELADLTVLAELAQTQGDASEATGYLRSAAVLAGTLDAEIAATDVALATARVADRAGDARGVLRALERTPATLVLTSYAAQSEAHALRARAYARLDQLEGAVAAGRQALATIERVRGGYRSGALRTAYTSAKADIYADQILALLRLGRTEEAFEVADAGRGRALVEHLGAARELVRQPAQVPALLAESERLLRRIDTLVARLREAEQARPPRERRGGADDDVRTRSAQLVAAREAYEALLIQAERYDASGAAILGSARVSARAVRESLRRDEALVEYFVVPRQLVIFVVTPDSVRSVVSNVSAFDLVNRARLARELLGDRAASAQSSAVLYALHRLLVSPVLPLLARAQVRQLLIVPHGTLAYLPFAALVDEESGEYLAQRFALLHLPTASALPALRSKTRSARGTSLARAVALAPLPDALPATRLEVTAFRRSLGRAEVLVGQRASESALRSALGGTGIVHVATHGVMNARNPMFSRVELADNDGATANDDGRLEVHELLSLVVRSSLVFLSGCETGLGAAWSTGFDRGEDYATLAQAFLYAGARNVVATLWRIGDEGAAEFAEHFYRELQSGRASPAEALAAAQRQMLADARYRSPYFWASYQLSGDGSAVQRAP